MPDAGYSPNYARRPAAPVAVRLLAIPVVVAIVVAGVWVTGGLLTDDMDVAMLLTGAWFAAAGIAAVLVARSRRGLVLPVLGAYAVTVAAAGGYLAYTSFVDDEVNEQVVTGVEASRAAPPAPAGGAGRDGGEAAPAPRQNVQVASGEFSAGEHPAKGTAAVVELAEGGRVLTLTDFETDPGPDLRVYLATDRSASDFEDLGALKGNVGDQQYELPEGVDLDRHSTVVIWCRAFSVEFGSARLEGS